MFGNLDLETLEELALSNRCQMCKSQRTICGKVMTMERWSRALSQSAAQFKELFGVKKEVFHEMLAVLTVAREERFKKVVGDQNFR